ncbi:MAG: methylated-DNA--[protein]-cysteine S-methyltransferase [Eubacteriales bacterium]|nr:methylated-DNA--[protein]-cysteine S-methyltransferase [Eubacteriales bacterium]
MNASAVMETPVGFLLLKEEDGALTQADFCDKLPPDVTLTDTPQLKWAIEQLTEYFAGQRREFDLPLAPKGTAFQKRCWDALRTIPYGETLSYGEEAARIGNPKACRAVGMANHYNPICVIIPCHRVIGKNGKMVGYGGGLSIKEFLLELERKEK